MLRNFLSGTGDLLRSLAGSGSPRLKWWICFSGALHLALILTLLVVPTSTARRDSSVPVYTVDLVAGVRPAPAPVLRALAPKATKPAPVELPLPLEEDPLDEALLEPVVPKPPKAPEKPPAPPKEKEQVKKPPEPKAKKAPPAKSVKKAPPERPKKKVTKPKKTAKPKKAVKPKKVAERKKAVKRKKPAAPTVAAKKKAPGKKLAKKKPKAPKRGAGQDSQLVKRLKQRKIDDAVATARERARLRREALARQQGSAGAGAGRGSGGGVLRGVEFLAYRTEMLNRIKERWTWIPKPKNIEVTVVFGIRPDGEIFGLKLLKDSGDASYDDSVVRAVRGASPLPPPPANYARDFTEVEVTFNSHDLNR